MFISCQGTSRGIVRSSIVQIQDTVIRTVSRAATIIESRQDKIARLEKMLPSLTTRVARELCKSWIAREKTLLARESAAI